MSTILQVNQPRTTETCFFLLANQLASTLATLAHEYSTSNLVPQCFFCSAQPLYLVLFRGSHVFASIVCMCCPYETRCHPTKYWNQQKANDHIGFVVAYTWNFHRVNSTPLPERAIRFQERKLLHGGKTRALPRVQFVTIQQTSNKPKTLC